MDSVPKWEQEVDVIVVGSGFAGLAAAIEARKAGASVVILEKMRGRGGNSSISDGYIAAAGTRFQEEFNIDDSVDRMTADMLRAGLGLNHPQLVRTVAAESNRAVAWTMDTLGIEYQPRVDQIGGHSIARTLCIKSHSTFHTGAALVRKMLAHVERLGMTVRTQACLTRLVTAADGRVLGARIREGFAFPKPDSGTPRTIRARKGVVLAAGGFGNDVRFRMVQDPRLTAAIESTNRRGATAASLIEAIRVGATPVHLSWIQLGPWGSPDEKGANIGSTFATVSTFPYGVTVDSRGDRLVNERADRRIRVDAMLASGDVCIGIVDAWGARYGAHVLPTCLRKGVVRKFDTLSDVSVHYGLSLDRLQGSVQQLNRSIDSGRDTAFQRPVRPGDRPLTQPPFYAIRLWPKVHYTMGGVQMDTRARVIGMNQKPIPGLYAAGEVTGGVHGACRLGSCAITDCLVFGRIAGRTAARRG